MNSVTGFYTFMTASQEPDKTGDLFGNPISLLVLLLLLIGIVIIAGFKKIKFTPRLITNVALAVAISSVLKLFGIMKLPQGGEVTFGVMLPIFLLAFAYGPEIGFLGGFIYGIVNLTMDPYILHPVQVIFDYPLPFMLLGVAGYFRKSGLIGVLIGGILRYVSHVVSGVVFFSQFAPEGMNPLIYSLSYNFPIVFIELALCILLLFILPVNRLLKAINPMAPEFSMLRKGN